MPQCQRSRRHDVGWWGGLTLPSQDVEHDIGGMDAVGDRLGTGRLDGRQTVGQNSVEDVDHLPIAIVGAGENSNEECAHPKFGERAATFGNHIPLRLGNDASATDGKSAQQFHASRDARTSSIERPKAARRRLEKPQRSKHRRCDTQL